MLKKPIDATGTVTIFNLLGQLIRTYDLAPNSGNVTVQWDATNGTGDYVSSGLYIVNVNIFAPSGERLNNASQKIMFLK